MAQAARSVPPVPVAPRPPHLRLVDRPPARRADPSPGVVRRRRVLAVSGLVALVALPFGWLSLTGAGPGEGAAVAALLRQGERDPAALCEHMSAGMLAAAGGRAACVRASPERGPGGIVGAVRVSGARATAIVRRAGGAERVSLVRQGGDWKVDDIR